MSIEENDHLLVAEIRRRAHEIGKLAALARSRGISISLSSGTSQRLDVLRELEVIAEKVFPL